MSVIRGESNLNSIDPSDNPRYEANNDTSNLFDKLKRHSKQQRFRAFHNKEARERKTNRDYDELYLRQFNTKESSRVEAGATFSEAGINEEQSDKVVNFLETHEITPYFRTKMIDWMLLVFH